MLTETEDSIEATALCPGCMRPVDGDPDFCPYCNAPLGLITLIDPKREAQSYAYFYQRGAGRPNTPIIFWGMLAVLLSMVGAGIGLCRFSLESLQSESLKGAAGFFLLGILYTTIGAVGLYKTIRNHRRIRAQSIEEDNSETLSE